MAEVPSNVNEHALAPLCLRLYNRAHLRGGPEWGL